MKHSWIIAILLLSQSVIGQSNINSFLSTADAFFKTHVTNGKVDYTNAKVDPALNQLVKKIADINVDSFSAVEKEAFYINAYNILVIKGATDIYPTSSVQSTGGFFDRKKHTIAGKQYTLTGFEKKELLEAYQDARLHFVLVCGAKGCPPIIAEAYTPAKLESQLERQANIALNNEDFIYTEGSKVQLSEIFKWYPEDFGGRKGIIPFINKYRTNKIATDAGLGYYDYDWSLNDTKVVSIEGAAAGGANSFRYVVSAAIPKGGFEFKLFNNLYTQRTGDGSELTNRSNFFTSSLSALYGVTNRFNAGLEVRYRKVSNASLPSSALDVFGSGTAASHRSGITAIGPRIRFAPFKALKNFSIQTTVSFPVGSELEGDGNRPYIDWNAATFNTQLFNDHSIGSNFSLFTELDIIVEDIGSLSRFSTPATVILSYFPNKKTTVYALGGYSPYWQSDFDYFAQGGIGVKYQVSPSFEIELLATEFSNKFLASNNGDAATYNIGFRYSY